MILYFVIHFKYSNAEEEGGDARYDVTPPLGFFI